MEIEIPCDLPSDGPLRALAGLTGITTTTNASRFVILCDFRIENGKVVGLILGGVGDYCLVPDGDGGTNLCFRSAEDREGYPNWPYPEPIAA